MEIEDIEQLVKMVRDARVSELTVTSGGSTVRLRKTLKPAAPKAASQPAPVYAEAGKKESVPEAILAEAADGGDLHITAPMVGIFHSIDAVSAVGVPVRAGRPVGVIESMKLMNDVVSDVNGVITEILVEDGMPVEYGQTLFRLQPLEPEA